jgi:hypothetical protein
MALIFSGSTVSSVTVQLSGVSEASSRPSHALFPTGNHPPLTDWEAAAQRTVSDFYLNENKKPTFFLLEIYVVEIWYSHDFYDSRRTDSHRGMAKGGHGLPKVIPGPAMPYPSTPCKRATPETGSRPF